MENLDWSSACSVCNQKAGVVNSQCGSEIVFTKQDPIKTTEYITVPAGASEVVLNTQVSVVLGALFVASIIICYVLWSRVKDIVDSHIGDKYGKINDLVEQKMDDAVKNFTYEAQNDIVKKTISIRVVRNK